VRAVRVKVFIRLHVSGWADEVWLKGFGGG